MQVLQLRYGRRELRSRDAYDGFDDLGIPDVPLEMDYSLWLVREGDDVVMIDTGYDVDSGEWLGEQSVLPVPQGLVGLGVDPAAVSTLVLTHFHFDHIGHVDLFPNATIVCARAEYDHWIGRLERGELEGEFTDAAMLAPIVAAAAEGRLRLIDESAEVRPGVVALVTGGHCPGELVVTVRGAAAGVVLAADAAHYGEQLEKDLPFFTYDDHAAMMAAFGWMRRLAASTGWTLVPGHDPETRRRFPALAGTEETLVLLDDAPVAAWS